MDKVAEKGQAGAVCGAEDQADAQFLVEKAPSMMQIDRAGSQTAHRDRRRLDANITGHAHDDRQEGAEREHPGQNALEVLDHAGRRQPAAERRQQPAARAAGCGRS